MREIIKPYGLSIKQLEDIKELENICREHEKLSMKLNWDMLETRPETSRDDFLCYEGDRLIGFLGLYGFGPQPIELTGMVHPEYRRMRIFRDLFSEAKKECIDRKAEKLLLVAERSSASGTAFSRSTGAVYSFSEYRMKFQGSSVPEHPRHGIVLRHAAPSDYTELRLLDAKSFGDSDDGDEAGPLPDEIYKDQYIAELGGKMIGKIGTIKEGSDGYIFGFAIRPEYRGKGYGRETLCLMLEKLLSEGIGTILLEVAVQNERALTLYKSSGFQEDTVYDYYELKLKQP